MHRISLPISPKGSGAATMSFEDRTVALRGQLLELFRGTLSGDAELRRNARTSAFRLAYAYAQGRPTRERPQLEYEETLLLIGAALERCLASIDEAEFTETFQREWRW